MENTNTTFVREQQELFSLVMRQVYLRMFLALLVTAITAFYVASTPEITAFIFGQKFAIIAIILVDLALVIGLSAALHKISTTTANIMLLLYSVINGVLFSTIFMAYELGSIAYTFFITAGVFLAMSIYGYTTKNSMHSFGSYCLMGLLGLIIASVVNIIVHSTTFEWIVSIIGVGIFMGLTVWDTQKIKEQAYNITPSYVGKLAVIGALSLYLDFVNIFLYLLRIFGKGRN